MAAEVFEEDWSPIPTLIGQTKSRAVYTVVYTALQGKFNDGKEKRLVIHQALFVSIDCSDY
jgi:hypothetical protein